MLPSSVPETFFRNYERSDSRAPEVYRLRIEHQRSIPDQGYNLEIDSRGIRLTAGNPAGFRHGAATLRQIREQAESGDGYPPLRVRDRPALLRRGFMLDISRCKVPRRAGLRQLVELLELLKYNELQLYTEHTFAYSQHRPIWEGWSPYDAEDILWLQEISEKHGIELVPNQNSFGHLERWLCHPDYRHLAEHPEAFTNAWGTYYPAGTTLKPNAESLTFLDGLYAELLPLFGSDRFNIGGDEPWELSRGWSQPRVEKEGKHAVYTEFLNALLDLARAHGKTPMFWADIICEKPDTARLLKQPAISLVWGYEADHPFAEQLRVFEEAGLPFYVVPGTSSWRSLGGRYRNAMDNLKAAAREAATCQADGWLLTDWGDNGHHHPWPFSLIPLAASASLAWNPVEDPEPRVEAWLDQFVFKDLSRSTSRAFRQLGSVYEAFAYRPHNSSPAFSGLFSSPSNLAILREQIDIKEISDARNRIREALQTIGTSRPECDDSLWIQDEFAWIADLMDAGLDRVEGALARETLPDLKRRQQELWLRRNRPGGLAQSLAYFPES